MLADVQVLVDDRVRDVSDLVTPDQRARAIAVALARYSTDRPRGRCDAVTAPGGPRLPLPSPWADLNKVTLVEWPISQNPPASIPHLVHRTPSGLEILVEADLVVGAVAHVHYTSAHLLSDTDDTIPEEHREAVAAYAAAWIFDQLAAASAGNTDPTIHADVVDQRSPAQEYASRARASRKLYAELIGTVEGPQTKPASAFASAPSRRRFPGRGAWPL